MAAGGPERIGGSFLTPFTSRKEGPRKTGDRERIAEMNRATNGLELTPMLHWNSLQVEDL